MKKKVAIFTGLVNIDKNLVGTAVIYKKIADIFVAQGYQVNLIIPELTDFKDDSIKFHLYNKKNNEQLIKNSSLVIFGAYPPLEPLLYAHYQKKIIMTYLWSIAPVGSLEFKDFNNKLKQAKLHQFVTASYNLSLLLSDKIFCRDEEIKKLVIGSLISLGRINLQNYESDKQLKNLIEVASFGIEKKNPKLEKNIYRGQYPGINKDDFILIWNGGVWNWNDGLTLIRAMEKLKNEKIKLIFQGFKHPGRGKSLSQEAEACLTLAKKLKLKDRNVFFPQGWIPYKERANFLLESDVGVVCSPDIPEANLFLKTRIYDYLWAELPIILSDCEAFASIIKEKGLGLIVKTGDVDDWVKNIKILKNNHKLKQEIIKNIKKYKKEIIWDKTLLPIKEFVNNPSKIVDKKFINKLIKNNIKANQDITF